MALTDKMHYGAITGPTQRRNVNDCHAGQSHNAEVSRSLDNDAVTMTPT